MAVANPNDQHQEDVELITPHSPPPSSVEPPPTFYLQQQLRDKVIVHQDRENSVIQPVPPDNKGGDKGGDTTLTLLAPPVHMEGGSPHDTERQELQVRNTWENNGIVRSLGQSS